MYLLTKVALVLLIMFGFCLMAFGWHMVEQKEYWTNRLGEYEQRTPMMIGGLGAAVVLGSIVYSIVGFVRGVRSDG